MSKNADIIITAWKPGADEHLVLRDLIRDQRHEMAVGQNPGFLQQVTQERKMLREVGHSIT